MDRLNRYADGPDAPRLYPLSTAQAAVWVAQALDPSSPIFNQGQYIEVFGTVEPPLFETAVRRAVAETDSLQLRFVETERGPAQYVRAYTDWNVPFFDVSENSDPYTAAEDWMRADMARADDLLSGPPFSFGLFRVAPERFLFYQHGHHIALDGVGAALFAGRIAANYTALATGADRPAEEFGSVLELIESELEYRRSDRFPRDRAYWLEQLKEQSGPVTLSGMAPAPARSFIRASSQIDASTAAALRAIAAARGASLAQLLTAGAIVYLAHRTGHTDVTVGIPLAGRLGARARGIVGMTTNVLPLRCTIEPGATFVRILDEVARRMREALRHQLYRGEDLRHDLGLRPHESDLYGMLVNVVQFDYRLTFAGYKTREHNLSNGPVDDLAIVAYDTPDQGEVRVFFNAHPVHYTAASVALHQERFLRMLSQVVSQPDARCHQLRVMDSAERAAVIYPAEPSGMTRNGPNLPALFAEQVRSTPDNVAVRCGSESLTYAQLSARVNRLARYLIAQGVGAEHRVAIAMERSVDLIVALLGALTAGGSYVPIDPGHPERRIARILEDARPGVILRRLDDLLLDRYPSDEVGAAIAPQSAAYVLYTSGSTGQPKGVVVDHAALSTFLDGIAHVAEFSSGSRHLAVTTVAFDISILELLAPLCKGGEVIIADSGEVRDPERIARLLRQNVVTSMQATPSHWSLLLEHDRASLEGRCVLVGGEPLSKPLARALCASGRDVWNLYGPTEATVWASAHRVRPNDSDTADGGIVSIGRPLPNYRLYVLGPALEPLPIGAAGELYISGAALARGYLNQPAMTAQRFVADPHAGSGGARMYRTGDLARWCEDGSLQYLGRSDRMVKIRGFRIELGDVEAALAEDEGVSRAVVLAQDDRRGGRHLVAYVVAKPGSFVDASGLRGRLGRALPDYMIPSAFVTLDALPLTPSGKVDHAALASSVTPPASRSGRPIASDTERLVADVWRSVLGVDRIDADDNFFDLGGHSLVMTHVMMQLRHRLAADISIVDLFQHPTVGAIARFLDAAIVDGHSSAERTTLDLDERMAKRALALQRRATAWRAPGPLTPTVE